MRKILQVLCLIAIALYAMSLFTAAQQSDLDLPILPPGDPRLQQTPPGSIPLPPVPDKPVVEIPAPPPVFFSEEIPATESLVYVLDFSCSMSRPHTRISYRKTLDRWEVVQLEAAKSISRLAQSFKFNVVIFGTNGGCGVTQWQKDMQQASEGQKTAAIAWINSFEEVQLNGGATPTAPGVILALKMKPETIVLLTDGYPSKCGATPGVAPWISHRRMIAAENVDGIPIQVFGIGISMSYSREFCLGVASDSSGTFVEIR